MTVIVSTLSWLAVCSILFLASGSGRAAEERLNGFSLRPSLVPVEEILHGGPPRDGIPALDRPEVRTARAAHVDDDDWVIGVAWGGEARAYPLLILVWHELVNDTLGGRPILVSYCPLCGSGIVFDRRSISLSPDPSLEDPFAAEEMPVASEVARRIRSRASRFGVSGLLYQSDLLMYDRETNSLWSQISARAITGPRIGARLELIRSRQERWGDWRARHPETTVVSRNTGYRQTYRRQPYGDYPHSRKLLFPVRWARRYHPKMPTVGLRLINGATRAYPAIELVRHGGTVAEDFGGYPVRVRYDADRKAFDVEAPEPVEVVESFWFAWIAFYPTSTIYEAGG